ncbi:hypothetical protein [Odoribacter splanchnicus]|uniref:hypothetical protein n=1 Tax=Odoribacter splanchnicus TaxID=28118 RepID=UPI00189A4F89|nr:hypothetical protein [Odoribacter splanchnicus]
MAAKRRKASVNAVVCRCGTAQMTNVMKAAITNLFLSSWSLCIHLSARLNENRTAQGMVDIRTPHSPKCLPA